MLHIHGKLPILAPSDSGLLEKMMAVPIDASEFLANFGALFENEFVRAWQWGGDDADFGKSYSWTVRAIDPELGQVVEVVASVDLQLTQLTLSISERESAADAVLTFVALVQFEDRSLAVNSVETEYSALEIMAVIADFNERTQ